MKLAGMRKNRMCMFGCAAVLSLLSLSAAAAPSRGGLAIDPAKAVIVSTGQDTKSAAKELKRHLDLIGGVDVPIVDKATPSAYVFRFDTDVIGGNKEACSWEASPTETVMCGNAYFAAVDFLENALGVRWPDGDAISYVAQNPMRLLRRKGSWAPELKLHGIRGGGSAKSYWHFARRMRLFGGHDAPSYGHAFTRYWSKYGKDHPEYFAMRSDGLRGPKNAKPEDLMDNIAVYAARTTGKDIHVAMCCTSTGLVNQIVENWIVAGKPEYINLCENDVVGQDSCQCPSCKALDVVPEKVNPNWETHYADRYVYFGNKVLEAARKHRADVKVCYYAYNATQDAPRRIKPDPASVAGFVPTYFSDSYISGYVGSWKKAGLTHFFYRPNRHHYYNVPYLPLGAEKHFFGIVQYLVREGCIGFDYDSNGARDGGFEWLEYYVLGHAMQDPSKSFEHWENHFCSAYGAARKDVKAYYRYWREEVWEKRLEPQMDEIAKKGKWFNFGRGLLWNLKDYYRASDFDEAEKFLKSAEAKKLAKPQRELVRRLRVAHDHARVFFEAVAHKSKANTEALVVYRKAHGYPLYTWAEQYYGDITGVEGLLGPEKKDAKK